MQSISANIAFPTAKDWWMWSILTRGRDGGVAMAMGGRSVEGVGWVESGARGGSGLAAKGRGVEQVVMRKVGLCWLVVPVG